MYLPKKQTPVIVLVLVDALLIGLGLLTYAYFHHVRVEAISKDLSKEQGTVAPMIITTPTLPTAPAATTGQTVSTAPAQTTPQETTAETTTTTTTTTTPAPTFEDDYFCGYGTEVTLKKFEADRLVYYIAEFFIHDVSDFRTAFAEDTYGAGYRQFPLEMATANHAICAINGDYYGNTTTNGVVIRNGYLYRNNPTGDVLVLYSDGSMVVYAQEEFDCDRAVADGAWQAWCFGPSLLDENGEAIGSFDTPVNGKNPRTALGYFEPGHYCFVCVEGRNSDSSGLDLPELALMMQTMGCRIAYNLDGGNTSMMTWGDHLVNNPSNGGRKSSDIIYVALPEEMIPNE